MLTIENFKKNNKYSDDEINNLVKNCDSWTDDQIWYIYDRNQDKANSNTQEKNLVSNTIRIHPYIKDRAVEIILKRG